MKRFLASGFGVGLFWKTYFGDKKGGGTLASFLFALITYVFNLNVLELSILFIVLVLTYLVSVDDNEANDDPSWITLDEIVGNESCYNCFSIKITATVGRISSFSIKRYYETTKICCRA